MSGDASLGAQPFYLHTRGGTVLCWWHAPARPSVALPVLLCPSWGDEEIGAYGGWRALARALAQHGVPVLRLDLPGEGDSLELAPDTSCWAAWLDALEDAALALRQVTAAPALHLLGMRLGSLLAVQVADRLRQGMGAVASVALLAPVASGRAFLREARLLSHGPVDEPLAEGELLAGGFVLNALSAQALNAATWPGTGSAEPGAACPVWVLERSDRPLPERSKAALAAWSGALSCMSRDDLGSITDIAHSAEWPDLAGPLCAWFVQQGPLAIDCAGLVWPETQDTVVGPDCVEGVVSVAPGLVAQCTRPRTAAQRATIFLSSGAERRIGPHRLWVRYARQRAVAGELCLRLDLAGIGDSVGRTHAASTQSRADLVYDPRCVDDVRAALYWLEHRHGVTQVSLVGLCSGAYHAWRCAVSGLPLSRVVVINPLVFHWKSGMSLDPTHHAFGQIDIADGAVRSLKDPARWLKLLRGQVNVQVILRAMAARLRGRLQTVARQVGRRLNWPLSEDVVSDLRQVIRHGTPMTLVFSSGDPGLALLRQEAGGWLTGLIARACVHLATIERADHTFSSRSGRDSLYNCLNINLSSVSELHTGEVRNLASSTPLQS